MTPSITESWIRIERWLAAYAPATAAALAPPAERAAIAAAEEAMGLSIPDPLVESVLRHDGTGHRVLLPPFWMLLSTQRMVDTWRIRTKIHGSDPEPPDHEDEDPEADFGPWWHRQWIPFAADGCGDELVLDQRPTTRRGRVGSADHEQGCFFERHSMWASLPVLFDLSATAMETGEVLDYYERVVTPEGELDWEIL
ncbi:SMI1/KNR4 family protein [Streptomyces piniterrae]|uniref:SMI1/KNR4 family protein n=1 Tax=Streptomyces piniterrae TaxID=2571125 RepID=A0A4U0NR08_9ACTN|nr:SMI1/KNR4 family protein [Streptomyces piniterrae]TJZ56976.1 SMI1/KNR4 family protein [Streptomyces piniterrae]